MKKTLAAVAVLGAFAGSALAADVQLYGLVDTGLRYMHFDGDAAAAGYDAVDKFEMKSGMQSGSRFGFKGTEDLGNGLTVGFVLESQFNSDDGSLSDKDHFFRREASLFLEGGFGKIAMGRIGSINNGVGSWAQFGMLSAFGTSWDYSAQMGTWAVGAGIWDNRSPTRLRLLLASLCMLSTAWVRTTTKTNPAAIVTMLSVRNMRTVP